MLAFLAALSCCKLLFVVGKNKITYLLTYLHDSILIITTVL